VRLLLEICLDYRLCADYTAVEPCKVKGQSQHGLEKKKKSFLKVRNEIMVLKCICKEFKWNPNNFLFLESKKMLGRQKQMVGNQSSHECLDYKW
jgi:hypothetical protein